MGFDYKSRPLDWVKPKDKTDNNEEKHCGFHYNEGDCYLKTCPVKHVNTSSCPLKKGSIEDED